MATETVFLDEGGVKVTNARFVVFGKTHALAGVTSVSSYKISPNRKGPIILIVIGLLSLAIIKEYAFIVIALGILWWILQKSTYKVHIESASGAFDALESRDESFIDRVVNALNDAIVHRG